MPSMRGIEKPHTSASTAATRCPRSASATERLVVTDDLPTPPLPDDDREHPGAGVGERVDPRRRRLPACDASTTWSGLRRRHALEHGGRAPRARRRSCRGGRRRPARCRRPRRPPRTIRRVSSARVASPGSGSGHRHHGTCGRRPRRPGPCPSSTIERRSSGSSTAARAAWTSSDFGPRSLRYGIGGSGGFPLPA